MKELIEAAKANFVVKVEPLFRVIKQQFGFQNTRVRSLAKKPCKINVLEALTILFLARRRLLAAASACR